MNLVFIPQPQQRLWGILINSQQSYFDSSLYSHIFTEKINGNVQNALELIAEAIGE